MKVTVLIENTGSEPLKSEHGLSFFIAFNGKQYLLDAGQSGAFMDNAKLLGVDLDHIDMTILSHGHYDHANGFVRYLETYPDRKIYGQPGIFEPYYSASKDKMHYIGLDDALLQNRAGFVICDEAMEIDDHVYLFADKGSKTAGKKLYRKEGDNYVHDDFHHEQSLVFDAKKGLVIFNSCSHSGLISIVKNIEQYMHKPVYAYIGGLHMKSVKHGVEGTDFTREELKEIADFALSHIQYVYTGHCTGNSAMDILKGYMQERLLPLYTGCVAAL